MAQKPNDKEQPPVPSQAQQANPENPKANDPEKAAKAGSSSGTGANAERQYFDGTVTKLDSEGRTVMSDHLDPGETLRRDTTSRYHAAEGDKRRADEEREQKNK